MNSGRLVELSVRDFVGAVGSADQPVPAGGSVAALTGASSAALVGLVCEVLERKSGGTESPRQLGLVGAASRQPGTLAAALESARRLQRQLLDLVDEDAAAFRTFLDAERGSSARQEAAGAVARVPLRIGAACVEVLELARTVAANVSGPMRLDIGAADQLAAAAARSALGIADYDLRLITDAGDQDALRGEIAALRSRAA